MGLPTAPTGGKQPKLHTKKYLYIKEDLQPRRPSRVLKATPKVRLCSVRTATPPSTCMATATCRAPRWRRWRLRCEDCHGTVSQFPWELPLGYGEEHGMELAGDARGLSEDTNDESFMFGTEYEAGDGYLLTARGNPFGNVVRQGDKVIMHSASGLDFEVPVLKQLAIDGTWKSPNAMVAMSQVARHMESMECYACHADWAPQCYGCHVTVDYSEGKTDVDWITNANAIGPNGPRPGQRAGHQRAGRPGQGLRDALLPALGRADTRDQRRRPP